MNRLNRSLSAVPALALAALVTLPSGLGAQGSRPAPAARDTALYKDLRYRMIGPTRGGRVTAVAGHPDQPRTFWMGATGGGVWRTDDAGESWKNVSDGFFATPSIGAIRVAPSDPDVVYVGTGSDGIRSNIITGLGVYRTVDGGRTWSFLGLRDAGQIGAVEVHPRDPDVAFVAAIGHPFGKNRERGVFRTTDGGKSWKKVLFVSDSTGASDLELHPANPRIVYAGMWRAERKPWTIVSGAVREGGIWKSADGGETWRRVTEGLPQGLIGKIDLAVSAADPRRVYALVEAPDAEEGLYRSDDEGETWRLVSTQRGLMDRPFYFTNVDADPTDADVVYVGAVGMFKSTDGGESWERFRTPHADNHDLWINPRDPRVMVQGNDGGANVSLDGGATWSTQLNQPTAELYQVAVDNRFPYWVYAGQQDNTTIGVPSLPPTVSPPGHPAAWWTEVGGCETGPAVPKRDDWRVVFSNCKGRFGRYSQETGQEQMYVVGAQNMYGHNPKDLKYRFQRVSPIHVSPHDPGVVYHASQYLHRTADGGKSWTTISPDLTANRPRGHVISGAPITRDVTGEEFFATIYAVEESPLAAGTIWVGTNDGLVQLTTDGGETWRNVTPKALPEDARIQSVEASPHDPAEAYVAAYRYLLDDWAPYVFRTTDHGRTWTRLTDGENGIPADVPVRVVREDPVRAGLLFAGTEFGMYLSYDEGRSWEPFQRNLPVVPITDIEIHQGDLVLSTMGRSFWIMDDIAPLRQMTPRVAAAPAKLFEPGVAHRTRYYAFRRGPADAEYAPPGAVIDYWIGSERAGPLSLEILDAAGRVVRRFSSEAPGETVTWEQAMQGPVEVQAGTPRLPRGRGLHRFVWDLSHPGPWAEDERRTGRDGPLAVPGRYTVRLVAGDVVESAPLELRMDPRVAADGVTQADLEAQLALNLRIRDLLSEARALAARIAGMREAAPGQARLEALEARLLTSREGSYPQPMLIDQIQYLYRITTQADQHPGDQAMERYEALRRELEEVESALGAIAAQG